MLSLKTFGLLFGLTICISSSVVSVGAQVAQCGRGIYLIILTEFYTSPIGTLHLLPILKPRLYIATCNNNKKYLASHAQFSLIFIIIFNLIMRACMQ